MIGRRSFVVLAGTVLLSARPGAAQQDPPRARVAIASMLTARDQLVALSTQEEITGYWSAFFHELRSRGWVDGETVVFEFWSAAGEPESGWGEQIARLVASEPDLIATDGAGWVRQLMAATSTIPIVTSSPTPLEFGIVASLARPEGNVTGFAQDAGPELIAKQVEMLVEIAPTVRRVAFSAPRRYVQDPAMAPVLAAFVAELRASQGLELALLANDPPVSIAPDGIERWLEGVIAGFRRERIDAAVLWNGNDFAVDWGLTARILIEAGIPAIWSRRSFPAAGGLMSYGDVAEVRGAGVAQYVDRILKGARPADLPFQQPRQYQLIINQTTATALGLVIPDSLRILADEIIE